jgi:hypothetical protein
MDKYSEINLDEVEINSEESHLITSSEEINAGLDSPPDHKRRVMWFSLALVGMIAAAFAAAKVFRNSKPQGWRPDFQQLFESEVGDQPVQATKFITSRSLAQVGAYSFDMKCPADQPICNPEVVFASKMEKSLEMLKKVAPDIYEELDKNTLTKEQQELILKVSLLVKNKEVLEEGQVVAETVKHWADSGTEVVHAKVKEALLKFSKEHGNEQDTGAPKMLFSQPGSGDSSIWEALMEPHLLSQIAGKEEDGPNGTYPYEARQLLFQDSNKESLREMKNNVNFGDFLGGFFGFFFPGIFLIFEILHYSKVLIMRKMLRVVYMWISGITGSIGCLAIASCPAIFLIYWFSAWLLFGNNPSEMKGVPWDFMLKKLPGLNHGRLLAADPLIAA